MYMGIVLIHLFIFAAVIFVPFCPPFTGLGSILIAQWLQKRRGKKIAKT